MVTPLGAGRVRMEYWNADGSPAEMCGNGLRCVGRYAVDEGLVAGPGGGGGDGGGGAAGARAARGRCAPWWGSSPRRPSRPLDLAGYHLESVSMGNPHAVAFVDDCYAVPVAAVGAIVEGDPHFPQRTNVGFATVVSAAAARPAGVGAGGGGDPGLRQRGGGGRRPGPPAGADRAPGSR